MTEPRRRTYTEAMRAAEELVGLLREGCKRIEVAGSIRRGAPNPKDIEVVAEPTFRADLFGGQGDDMLNETVRLRVREKKLDWRNPRADPSAPTTPPINEERLDGRKYYPLWLLGHGDPFPVDLFVVRPPAQWGAVFAIRTGPADYARGLVTMAHRRQLKCDEGRLVSTALATVGTVIDTPEERDFILACGGVFLPPDQRR